MQLRPRTATKARPIDEQRRYDERPEVYPRGRRCITPGCITVLSQYTKGPQCMAHTPRHQFIRTLESYEELMSQ